MTAPQSSCQPMESHPTSKSTSAKVHVARALAILLLLGIIIATIVVVMRTKATDHSRQTTLPDGTVVELLGTSVGSATFTTDKPLYRFARRWLPNRLQGWIPASLSGSSGSGSNSLTVWFRLNNKPPGGFPLPWENFLAEDETGFRYSSFDGVGYVMVSSGTGISMYKLSLNSYPRRQSSFVFDFVDARGATIGSVRVPNPVHGPFPEWRPMPLPQSQTKGPVTLNLLGLTAYPNQPWPSISPNWRVDSVDPSWSNSIVRYFSYQDPTGNEGYFLSPRESAWKLQAVVYRKSLKFLPSGDRMTLTNLPVPAPGNFVAIDQTNTCAGVAIKVLLIADAGRLEITNNTGRALIPVKYTGSFSSGSSSGPKGTVDNWNSPTPFLMVETQDLQPHDDLKVRLIDDGGFEIKGVTKHDNVWPNGKAIHTFAFTPPETAKSLTVEILINRPLQFEFLVNPADAHPPKP